jgi:hypothetical protein
MGRRIYDEGSKHKARNMLAMGQFATGGITYSPDKGGGAAVGVPPSEDDEDSCGEVDGE